MDRDHTPLDEHGQPINPSFCYTQNKDKALQDLLGVIQGIAADHKINNEEAAFLSAWLKDNSVLADDHAYIDLMELTTDVLADGIITEDESGILLELINNIIEYQPHQYFSNDKQAVQRLIGICKGMASDRMINNIEIMHLSAWLRQSETWTNNPIAKRIRSKLRRVLQGGVITEEERIELLNAMQNIAGSSLEYGVTGGLSLQLKWDTPSLAFEGKSFCFTGRMIHGTRTGCHEITKQLGGVIHKRVLKQTDYLVIGDLSSRDWAHTSFGRKIEKAVTYKKAGAPISIIQESHWKSFIPT